MVAARFGGTKQGVHLPPDLAETRHVCFGLALQEAALKELKAKAAKGAIGELAEAPSWHVSRGLTATCVPQPKNMHKLRSPNLHIQVALA